MIRAEDMSVEAALAALAWQIELGADEAILDSPVDRFRPAEDRGPRAPEAVPPHPVAAEADPAADALALARAARSLGALQQAMAEFEGCALKRGAKSLVFADGNPAARVMIVGEAPGREEDQQGKPFVGRSGQLLDRMFACIGLARTAEDPEHALYITNTLPWRPPSNRDPSSDELAMMMPFLQRHVELADPQVLITMGNAATKTLLATSQGITRLRGRWAEAWGRPVLPMFHPAALLRDPVKKREAWADLLTLKARLDP